MKKDPDRYVLEQSGSCDGILLWLEHYVDGTGEILRLHDSERKAIC